MEEKNNFVHGIAYGKLYLAGEYAILEDYSKALITSVDAFLAGIGMGFLEAQMIHQSLTIFPITVLSVIGGVYVGYRLGTVHNSQAYLAGGALFLIAGVDVVIQYCMY